MHKLIAAALLASTMAVAAWAEPVPKEQLLVPPAEAEHFVVLSDAGKHGDAWRWTQADGSTAYRESILLRGLIFEQDEVVRTDANGRPLAITIRGITPQGDSAETFSIDAAGIARWKSPVDSGEVKAPPGAVYWPSGGVLAASDLGLAALIRGGDTPTALLPSGRGSITPSRSLTVNGQGGPKTVRLYFINGVFQSPTPIWLDEDGRLFGVNNGLGILPADYADAATLRAITAAQEEAIAELSPAIASRLLTADARRPILFRDVKMFDADGLRWLEHQNVLVNDGKIAMLGTDTPELPDNAQLIDGRGKTLVPGLWDNHMHLPDDFAALGEVALGVTSIRNPGGTPIELVQSMARRRSTGTLVAPEAFTSVIVDAAGPLAAQNSIAVASEEETLAAIRRISDAGLTGVKFYTSMKPEWIVPAATLAHELGLEVHGHIPAGMRTLDAVDAGYDEITHLYFATMQAMPQSIVDKSNTTLRLTGPARYFKDVDFNAEPTRTVIKVLADKKIAVDPTLVIIERLLLSEAGTLHPAYRSYAGTLPPAVERSNRSGPVPLPEGTTREDAAASFRHMLEYVSVLQDAGVPIVAGTDGAGPELVRELELYVAGGMSPAEALASATIVAARNVGVDGRTGSIAVGKEADLLLVDGDPERDIGALRRVDKVVLDGALLDGAALRAEAGFSGMPK